MAEPEGIQYLKRCVVQDKDTWFSIHHMITYADGRDPDFPGTAHQDIRTAFRDAMYWSNKGHDVYLAQGAFAEPAGPGRIYPKARRQWTNLVGCKNLYMDLDVKKGAYASRDDALTGLYHFVHKAGLPAPTVIVASGTGGIHVYWTLNEIFGQKIFLNMASRLIEAGVQHGVFFDQVCTRDRVRLLRIPGTWNFKQGEALPVKLLLDKGIDIELAKMQEALFKFKAAPDSRSHSSRGAHIDPRIAAINEDMGAGVGEFPPADIDEVAKVCPFVADALATGGKDHSEPLWHACGSLAAHCIDPPATFHRLSNGHPGYDPEHAEQKLATIIETHEQQGIGPHTCSVIHQTGAPQCATCPLLALNSTPLMLPHKQPNGHVYPPQNTAPNSDDLPWPYYRGKDDLIYGPHWDKDKQVEGDICVLEYQIVPGSGFIEDGSPFRFTFTTYAGERYLQRTIEVGAFADVTSLGRALFNNGLPVPSNSIKHTQGFFVSYLKLLVRKRETNIIMPPFGWAADSKGDIGFAYAGEFVSPNETARCKSPIKGLAHYTATGDPAVWRGLADIILTKERPDLAVMTATAFGAPLVGMTGEDGVLIGIVSAASGIGKTTHLKLGQAVYGRPYMGGFEDTVNSTFSKAGQLKNLPIYYDEIKTDDQIKNFCKVVFQLTGGHEKARSNRSGEMREVETFETSVSYAANKSMVAAVKEIDKGTDASWYRMFEIQAASKKEAFDAGIGHRMALLKHNYGGVGKEYATFLGQNHTAIRDSHTRLQESLIQKFRPAQDHRYWMAAISTTMLGAKLANELGYCTFPLQEMYSFMLAEYRRMVKDIETASGDYMNNTMLVATIGAYLNDKLPRNLYILDKAWINKRGRPPIGFAKILNDIIFPAKQWGTIEAQLAGNPVEIRISDSALGIWCAQHKHQKTALVHALETKAKARIANQTFGAGTPKSTSATNQWIIDTTKAPMLADMVAELVENYPAMT